MINDPSETGIITKFEATFPLITISLDEYERRIKKFIDSETCNNEITLDQLIECFRSHPNLNEITNENSLTRKLFTDKVMIKKGPNFYIPYLMLLGILYCASNAKARAQKFFELCQMELNPCITATDKEI